MIGICSIHWASEPPWPETFRRPRKCILRPDMWIFLSRKTSNAPHVANYADDANFRLHLVGVWIGGMAPFPKAANILPEADLLENWWDIHRKGFFFAYKNQTPKFDILRPTKSQLHLPCISIPSCHVFLSGKLTKDDCKQGTSDTKRGLSHHAMVEGMRPLSCSMPPPHLTIVAPASCSSNGYDSSWRAPTSGTLSRTLRYLAEEQSREEGKERDKTGREKRDNSRACWKRQWNLKTYSVLCQQHHCFPQNGPGQIR